MADETPKQLSLPEFVLPTAGESIRSIGTNNTYEIGQQLGEGNFGIVYACTDTWGNSLAAKVLKPREQGHEYVQRSTLDEFLKLNQLRHPNITYVYDAFEYRGACYIVTEQCSSPLTTLIGIDNFNGQLWVKPIARCVLQALHFIHINGYTHHDIHLGNVLVGFYKDEMSSAEAMNFKVADLGIAKLTKDIDPQTAVMANWMLPPEFIDPNEFGKMDHRVDIYHTGLLLLSILMGQEIRLSRDDVVNGHPRNLALGLSPPYNFALEKALRRHVEHRTASAMELWRDIISTAQ